MHNEDVSKGNSVFNAALLSLNNFMLEQIGIIDYEQLIKIIVVQLDKLCNPAATVYSEYEKHNKLLRIKEIKANEGILEMVVKIGGKKVFSTTTPVNREIYEKMASERVEFVSSLYETFGGALPKALSNSIDKALNVEGYLGLSFMVDNQVYGTAVIALREEPDAFIIELLRAYVHFTSNSLKRVITEQALRKGERELKNITENMTELIAMTDTEGRFTYLSGNHYNLYGYEKEELLGRYAWDIIYAEDMAKMAGMFNKHIAEKSNGRAEYRVVRKDGSLIWADTVGSILKDDGETSGALFVTRDVTDRKRAEEALRESENRSRAILNTLPDLMFIYSRDGYYLDYHASDHCLLYVEPEKFIGKSIFEVLPGEVAGRFFKAFKDACKTNELQIIDYALDVPGGLKHFEARITSLDEQRLIAIIRDVTEQKENEKQLRDSEHRLNTYIAKTPAVIYSFILVDGVPRITYVNENVKHLLGFEPEDFINNFAFFLECFHPDDVQNSFDAMQRLLAEGRLTLEEYRFKDKQGNYHWLHDEMQLITHEDGTLEVIGAWWDITERKKAEEHIRYISYHDQLTGLYNRHYFEYCKNGLKDVSVVSVIMTDINNLKLVNDIYGHEAGDELLRKYAEHIKKSFKDRDLFFRWGGDEFIIILKNTKEAKSWELCNRLISYCEETFVKDIPLSISVGISSKLGGVDIDRAIKEAEDMMYKNKLSESKRSKIIIMKTLLKTLSGKSFETKEHIDRMTLLGRQYGEKLSLPPSELDRLETLIMLHDIGKINIDGHIMMKETALTDEDWKKIKKHPEVGYRITRTAEEFAYIGEELLAHHERWDGKGYPQGLRGDRIPYLSRILNLIDSYDIMNSGRPYKKKMPDEEIIKEIESCSGKQFDPDLAEKFISLLRENINKN